jgi:hypothetical protein
MKRMFWLALLGCLFFSFPAFAKKGGKGGGGIGIGLAIGDPTGFTAKFILSQSTAFDLFIGEDFDNGNDDDLQINFDWLFSPAVLGSGPGFTVPFYFGVGGIVQVDDDFGDDVDLGVRAPVGIAFLFQKTPLELFIELGLELIFIDNGGNDDDLDLDANVGIRYYF